MTADDRRGWSPYGGFPGPEYDYNGDGTVNTTDFSQVKLNFGNTAGECP